MHKFIEKHAKLIEAIAICLYICIGTFSMVYAFKTDSYLHSVLGFILTASGLCKVVMYFGKERRHKYSHIYIICAITKIVFGIFFIFGSFLPIEVVCIIWGVLDIVSGLFEGIFDAIKIRHQWGSVIETFLDIGDIVLGILLCCHLAEGLKIHITYLSLYFLINAMALVLELGLDQEKLGN